MKFAIFLVIVCASNALAKKVTVNSAAMDKYMAIGKECAAKEGASDQDVANAMAFKIPDTAAGKCLHACVGERIGAVADNKLSMDGVMNMVKEAFGDDAETMNTAKEVVGACISVTDADRCESTFKIITCTDQEVKARGIEV